MLTESPGKTPPLRVVRAVTPLAQLHARVSPPADVLMAARGMSALPASAYTWQVDYHTGPVTRPFLAAVSGSKTGSFVVPTESPYTEADVFFRVILPLLRPSLRTVYFLHADRAVHAPDHLLSWLAIRVAVAS